MSYTMVKATNFLDFFVLTWSCCEQLLHTHAVQQQKIFQPTQRKAIGNSTSAGGGEENTVYVASQVNIFQGKYEFLKVLSFEVPVYPPHPLRV